MYSTITFSSAPVSILLYIILITLALILLAGCLIFLMASFKVFWTYFKAFRYWIDTDFKKSDREAANALKKESMKEEVEGDYTVISEKEKEND